MPNNSKRKRIKKKSKGSRKKSRELNTVLKIYDSMINQTDQINSVIMKSLWRFSYKNRNIYYIFIGEYHFEDDGDKDIVDIIKPYFKQNQKIDLFVEAFFSEWVLKQKKNKFRLLDKWNDSDIPLVKLRKFALENMDKSKNFRFHLTDHRSFCNSIVSLYKMIREIHLPNEDEDTRPYVESMVFKMLDSMIEQINIEYDILFDRTKKQILKNEDKNLQQILISFHKQTKLSIKKLEKIIDTNKDNIVFKNDNYIKIAKDIFNLQQNIIDNYAFSRMLKQKYHNIRIIYFGGHHIKTFITRLNILARLLNKTKKYKFTELDRKYISKDAFELINNL